MPEKPLDVLAQQIVAEVSAREYGEDELFALTRRAWPYRDLGGEEFDRVVALHTEGRRALLHRDGVNRRLLATKRARLTATAPNGRIRNPAPNVASVSISDVSSSSAWLPWLCAASASAARR